MNGCTHLLRARTCNRRGRHSPSTFGVARTCTGAHDRFVSPSLTFGAHVLGEANTTPSVLRVRASLRLHSPSVPRAQKSLTFFRTNLRFVRRGRVALTFGATRIPSGSPKVSQVRARTCNTFGAHSSHLPCARTCNRRGRAQPMRACTNLVPRWRTRISSALIA